MTRRGPRPLLLHLTLAMLRSSASVASSTSLNPGWPNSNARAVLDALAAAGQRDAFPHAVLLEALRQDADLVAGILAYRRHPWRRAVPPVAAIWREGGSTLLDHGGTGPVLLVVPSLVNRSWVLDLSEQRSMLRWLATHGLHPILLDWGTPGPVELDFSLSDYVNRLDRALAVLDQPVILAGYCMGGLLAVASAQRNKALVCALALLATPWDFHAPDPERAARVAACVDLLEPVLALGQGMPVDALQSLFALLDPWGIAAKYRAFAHLPPDSPKAERFVALEDWLNDGIALAEPVARECLTGWYGANAPMLGTWRIDGEPVDPGRLSCPAFVAIPSRDRIVPPESAEPLARLIPGATRHAPAAGHVGMVAGASAERALWRPLRDWALGEACRRA